MSSVISGYDEWAATYDAIDNPLIAQAACELEKRARWFAGASVLELGCGTGRNAAFALAAGARGYLGIDGSCGMLDQARRRMSDQRAQFRLDELIGGAQRARGEFGAFDLALISLVLEHFEKVEPIVAAAAESLVPGGRLLIQEIHPELQRLTGGAQYRVAGGGEVHLPSWPHAPEESAWAVRSAGMNEVEVVERMPSEEALARSVKLGRYRGVRVLSEIAARRP
jgi:SAM-dependent methyltransferase